MTETTAFDPYAWGYDVGRRVALGEHAPLEWRNADGSLIPWQTSDKPFPSGYRAGLEDAS